MWEKEEINLGRIKERVSKRVEFKSIDKLDVTKIITSCSCTAGIYNEDTKTLQVTYKGGDVPVHLAYKGEVEIRQQIRVESLQGEFTLYIKATIEK